MKEYDLIIVGAGTGNMLLGPELDGWSIAIVERDRFGGTCLNRGCIPSKMLIHSGDVAHAISSAGTFGIQARVEGLDWRGIIDRVFAEKIDPIAEAGERFRQSQEHVDVYKGDARFTGMKTLQVNGETIRGERVILAAGSRPNIPPIPGLEDVPYHTSDTVMRLPEQPNRLVVLGGGYIGAELGHFFGSLGTEVTIIDRGDALIKTEDEEVSRRFTEIYEQRFNVRLNTSVIGARSEDGEIRLDIDSGEGRETIATDVLLVAAGRTPNAGELNVAATGVEVTPEGRVKADERLRTGVPGVWALGDICTHAPLKHIANLEARTVIHNMLHPDDQRSVDYNGVPHAVFGSPQVASVGMREQDARAAGVDYVVGRRDFGDTAYGWAIADTQSFAKIIAHAETRKILGAHIIGPEAPILLQPLVNAIKFGQTVEDLTSVVYIHPALTEVIEQALLEM